MKEITHIERLDSLAKLEKEGFEGMDVSLEISLFEYGLAWKELENEFLFIYSIKTDSDGYATRFDRATFNKSLDFSKEFDWIKEDDWQGFLSGLGITQEDWNKDFFAIKIYTLVKHFEYENIFGTSYWEGFEINK